MKTFSVSRNPTTSLILRDLSCKTLLSQNPSEIWVELNYEIGLSFGIWSLEKSDVGTQYANFGALARHQVSGESQHLIIDGWSIVEWVESIWDEFLRRWRLNSDSWNQRIICSLVHSLCNHCIYNQIQYILRNMSTSWSWYHLDHFSLSSRRRTNHHFFFRASTITAKWFVF